MKKNITKTVILVALITLITSCGLDIFNGVKGNRNVSIKDRTSSEKFTQIKVSTGLDLYVSIGSENKITIEADENLHEIIITEIDNGVLKVYATKSIWSAQSKKIHVTVPNLEGLSASSGAHLYSKEQLTANNLKVMATSGGIIQINVAANTIATATSSGAEIDISGTTKSHRSGATSGSSVNAFSLKSDKVSATVSSGARIKVFATESITAAASSGGNIDYMGNPKIVEKSSSSGGSITAK